jgi:hypothetical protein
MKTAVEWLIEQLTNRQNGIINALSHLSLDQIYNIANEMFEQQIIDFADNYVDNCVITNENMAIPTIMGVSQYYLETFKKNNI